ncbi:MAG: imidazolonepropionase, partial [Candidatus Eisenbacteria bacterium]
MNAIETVDIIIAEAKQRLTLRSAGPGGPKCGSAMRELAIVENGAVAARDGRIVKVGRTEDVLRECRLAPDGELVRASGRVVMPGFVDCHTHAVFAGKRAEEFEARLAGHTYQEIAAAGGGIRSSVRAFRESSRETIRDEGAQRLDKMLQMGTTTVEIKSGYGLSTADEIKAL